MAIFKRQKKENTADPVLQNIATSDTVPWFKKKNLRFLYFLLFPTCMGIEITSGFDSQMMNALQMNDYWVNFFDDPQGALKGIMTAAYSLGAILSLPFIPKINDKFGRRWSIFGGSAVMVVGAIVQCFSAHVAQYIVARMILGFGIPTCIVSASSLIGELAYPKERPIMTSLFNVSYFIGQITAAAICLGTDKIDSNWGWRLPSLLQACPSMVQMAFVLFLPESPRWLISHDRIEEAQEILIKYHAEGDSSSEFVQAEVAQIDTAIKLERDASKQNWLDLLRTAGMRRRALISSMLGLFTQWSGNTLISYYLGDLLAMIGYTTSTVKLRVNMAYSCWQLACGLAVALLVTRFRRRTLYMTTTILLLSIYIGWTVSMKEAVTANEAGKKNEAAGWMVLIFIFLYSPSYNIGYNALSYTYLVELWPYALRSRGITLFQLFGRMAGFFTTFVNPIGLENVSWKYLISYCCWLAVEVVFVYFMFPETSGRTLEELAFLFEDKELAEQTTVAVEKVVHHEDMGEKTGGSEHVSKV